MNNKYFLISKEGKTKRIIGFVRRIISWFTLERVFLHFFRHIVLILMMGIFITLLSMILTSQFKFIQSNISIFNGIKTVNFDIFRECNVNFILSNTDSIEIDRTYTITTNNTILNVNVGKGIMPFQSCNAKINMQKETKYRYIFNCFVACHFQNDPSTFGSSLDLKVQSNFSNIQLTNLTLNNMLISSEKGSMTLRNSSLDNSIISVKNYEIRIINNFSANYIIHEYSSKVYFFGDPIAHAGGILDVFFCELYTNCTDTYSPINFPENFLTQVDQENMFGNFMLNAQNNNLFASPEDHYHNLKYLTNNTLLANKNYFLLAKCNIMLVPETIYRNLTIDSIKMFQKFIYYNDFMFPYDIFNTDTDHNHKYPITNKTIFTDNMAIQNQMFLQQIYDFSYNFFKNSYQKRIAFINFLPLNINVIIIKEDAENIIENNIDFLKDCLNGSNENLVINMPIMLTSYTVFNEFVNLLFFVNKTKEIFNMDSDSDNYEALIQFNNTEIFSTIKKYFRIIGVKTLDNQEIMPQYFQIRWTTEQIPLFWPLMNNGQNSSDIMYFLIGLFLTSIFFIILIFFHIRFIERSIKYYNERKILHNNYFNTKYKLETLPSNFILKYIQLMFLTDYHLVSSCYFNAMLGRFQNSVTIFYQLCFKKTMNNCEQRILKGNEMIKFSDLVHMYKNFCFFNDLTIHPIENFINEAKLKDFNHKISMKDSEQLYINNFQLFPETELTMHQNNLLNFGDSLDLFITQKCSFFINKSTKLKKFIKRYELFCKINDLFCVEFNEEYLRYKYRLQIYKKQFAYIEPEEIFGVKKFVYTLQTKYFVTNKNEIENKNLIFNRFLNFLDFSFEFKKVIFNFIFDMLCFQNIFVLFFLFPDPQYRILQLLYHLNTRVIPSFMFTYKALAIISFVIIILVFVKIFKKNTLLDSTLCAKSPLFIAFYMIIWLDIYYEKFTEIYLIFFYLLRSWRLWIIFRYEMNTEDINIYLLIVMNVLWLLYIAFFIVKYKEVKELIAKKYRVKVINAFKINLPVTHIQKDIESLSGEDDSKSVRKLVTHLQVIKTVLQNKENFDLTQFEHIMSDFFQQIDIAKNEDMVKFALILNKGNVQLKDLSDTIIKIAINQTIFSVYNNQDNIIKYKEQVEVIHSILKELIYIKLTRKIGISEHLLKIFEKLFKNKLFLVHQRELQNFYNIFLSKNKINELEFFKIENIIELKDIEQNILEIMRPLINPLNLKMTFVHSRDHNLQSHPILNKEAIFKKLFSNDANSSFNKIFNLKIINIQNSECELDKMERKNHLKLVEKFIIPDKQYEKINVGKDTIKLIYDFRNINANIFQEYTMKYFKSKNSNDPETDLKCFILLNQAINDPGLLLYIQFEENYFSTNPFIQFFCKQFSMSFKELLGMIYMLNGLHTEYNFYFIVKLCKNNGFPKMSSFCNFIYSLLNYENPKNTYWLKSYLPPEFIEMFLYFKNDVAKISEDALNIIATKLNDFHKFSQHDLKSHINNRDLEKINRFKIEYMSPESNLNFYFCLFDLLVDVISLKNDKMFVYEKILKTFSKFINDKKFLVFFKELYIYINSVGLFATQNYKMRLSLSKKFPFIFPNENQISLQYFENLMMFSTFSEGHNINTILPKIYLPNSYSSKINTKFNSIIIQTKKQIDRLVLNLTIMNNFKKHFKSEVMIRNSKLLGTFVENLVTQRVKYSFEETNSIIDMVFTTFFKFDSLDSFRNNKFNEFLVCLFKSVLMSNPLYLSNFFTKFHQNCLLMPTLIQRYFDSPDLDTDNIYEKFTTNVVGMNQKQVSVVQLYFMIIHKQSIVNNQLNSLHEHFEFDPSFTDLLQMYVSCNYEWKKILQSFNRNISKNNRSQILENELFIDSPFVKTLVWLHKQSQIENIENIEMSEIQLKIICLKSLKNKICVSPKCKDSNQILKAFEDGTYQNFFKNLSITKCEFVLIFSIVMHLYGENEIITFLNILGIDFHQQRLLTNLMFIKKELNYTKCNSIWNKVLLNSSFFKEIKFNPLVSWLIIFSIKNDYYALVKLLKSQLQILNGHSFMKKCLNVILHTMVSENDNLSQTFELPANHNNCCPQKIVNCPSYYYWKIHRIDQELVKWLEIKPLIISNGSKINEGDNNFSILIAYMLFVYNIEKSKNENESKLEFDFIRYVLRMSIYKTMKHKFIGVNNFDQVRIKKALNYEKKGLKYYFETNLSKRVIFDIEDNGFVQFCDTQYKLRLKNFNFKLIYYSFNREMIRLFKEKLRKENYYFELCTHLEKCLNNRSFCCWNHSLLSLTDNCINQLFLKEENYILYGSLYINILIKFVCRAYNILITKNGIQETDNCSDVNENQISQNFLINICTQSLLRRMTSMKKSADSKRKISVTEFGRFIKFLIHILDVQYFYDQNRLFNNIEKNILLKTLEIIFTKISLNTSILTEHEKRALKAVLNIQKEELKFSFDAFSPWLNYFKIVFAFEDEKYDQLVSYQTFKKEKTTNLYKLIENELFNSKYSKITAKTFINQCSFSLERLEFLKALCNYQRSYIKYVFDNFQYVTNIFPQEQFDLILLFLNFPETVTNMEKSFLQSVIKTRFKSNPSNLIDLIDFLTSGFKSSMFRNYFGNSKEAKIYCSILFGSELNKDQFVKYCKKHHKASDEIINCVWLLIKGIQNPQDPTYFNQISSHFYLGKQPETAHYYVKCIEELLFNLDNSNNKSTILTNRLLQMNYLDKISIEETQSFIQIMEAVIDSDFTLFHNPHDNFLKIFFEKLSFDNVEILRVFELIDALKNPNISIEESASILYQFISFSQYDLININLTEAKNLLIVLKCLFTGNYTLLFDLFKNPAFKKQYTFLLSFYIYLQKTNSLLIMNDRSEWENLFCYSRDFVFLQLLKTNFSKNNKLLEEDHNIASMVNDQHFLQDYLYNFDDKKLSSKIHLGLAEKSKKVIKIETINTYKLNPIINPKIYSNEIHRLYYYFINSDNLYTELNNLNDSQQEKIRVLNILMNNREELNSKPNFDARILLKTLFDQNEEKSESIMKYLVNEHKIYREWSDSFNNIPFGLQHNLLKHIKDFSQIVKSSDNQKFIRIFEKILYIVYENDINIQIANIINLLCKSGVFTVDSKIPLLNNFTKLNFNTIYEFIRRLQNFNFGTPADKVALIYYLNIIFSESDISHMDQLYFFYMHSVLSKEENLITHWFRNKEVPVKIFQELKQNYQKLVGTKKSSLNAIEFIRKEHELKELYSLKTTLDKSLFRDQRLYNIYLYKIIECVNQKGIQSFETIKYVLCLLHNFKESDKFYVKLFFEQYKQTHPNESKIVSKEYFDILNNKIVDQLVTKEFTLNPKYSVFNDMNIILNMIFFFFGNFFFLTSRFGSTVIGVKLDLMMEVILPRIFICNVISCLFFLHYQSNHLYRN